MEEELNPIGPITPVLAGQIDGTDIYSNATNLVEKGAPRPDALKYGKYSKLGLFEEGPTVNGERTIRYRKDVPRAYSSESIKNNLMPAFQESNPGAKLRFDYKYGGELEVNPLNSII